MNTRNTILRRNDSSAVALVVTLCFLVLISVSIVAFLVRAQLQHKLSFSSVSQKKAELLGLSATNLIIAELQAEMAHGSRVFQSDGTEVTDLASASGTLVYQPRVRRDMLPEPRGGGGSVAGWTNLVKLSCPTTEDDNTPLAFYSGGRSLIADSSSAGTSVPSLNGRFINDTIWRLPKLVDNGSPPLSPRWCIVTRQGANSFSDSDLPILKDQRKAECAIGRFAFAAYETGGLLDINIAGNALTAAENANRAFLNQANLGQIIVPQNPGETPVEQLLNWRSPLSKANPALLFATAGSTRAIRFGEQHFVNRQDLLHYSKLHSEVIGAGVLPLLTVFTRELNAPCWYPAQNALELGASSNGTGNAYAYNDNQNKAGTANQFVVNVRVPPAAGTANLTGYHPDGSSYSYSIKPGEPFLQRRFHLGRLKWIGYNGPQNGGTAANIQACFGLAWNSGSKWWTYVGPTGNSPRETIATLDQVALEKREPNFFELLQAGILKGSLGLFSADQATASTPEKDFASSEVQVFQIGANLIDQADADSYPTCLTFRLPATTVPANPAARYDRRICGSENIPLIYRIDPSAYRPMAFNREFARGWLEFEMWNPYQAPITTPSAQPSSFRIRQTHGQVGLEVENTYNNVSQPRIYGQPVTTKDNSGILTVSASDIGAVARDPKLLNSLRTQSGVSVTSTVPENIFTEEGEAASYTGFYCGEIDLPYPLTDTKFRITNANWRTTPGVGVVLEYDYGNGDWRPVQEIFSQKRDIGIFKVLDGNKFTDPVAGGVSGQLLQPLRRYSSAVLLDPRTLRFGFSSMGRFSTLGRTPAIATGTSYPVNTERTVCWSLTDKLQQWTCGLIPLSPNFLPRVGITGPHTAENTPAAIFRYADNRGDGRTGAVPVGNSPYEGTAQPMYLDMDGVQRSGDALWNKDSNSLEPDTVNGVFPMLPIAQRPQDRPLILNRPFLNVGEMGYAFRDLPFKSLDFSSSRSADAALLDLFCIDEGDTATGLVAGRVNLNTKHPEVLKAILIGSTRTPLTPASAQLSVSDSETIANALVTLTTGSAPEQGPLLYPAELAQRLLDSPALRDSPAIPNQIKGQKETAIRSLAALGQTRTWNLMLDVVTQVGRYSPNASDLSQFTVEGETRYWVHIAIDRYTGKVVDQLIEPVIY